MWVGAAEAHLRDHMGRAAEGSVQHRDHLRTQGNRRSLGHGGSGDTKGNGGVLAMEAAETQKANVAVSLTDPTATAWPVHITRVPNSRLSTGVARR